MPPGVVELELEAEVGSDRRVTLQLPTEVEPGKHTLHVSVSAPAMPHPQAEPLKLSFPNPNHPLGLPEWELTNWPKDCLFTRDDIYGDEDDQ